MRGFFRVLVVLLSLSACKTPREKFEDAARAHLALLPALAGPARDQPSLSEHSADALKALTDFSVKYKNSNALLIQLEELDNPTVRWALPVRLSHRSPAVDIATTLNIVNHVDESLIDPQYDPACPAESPDWQRMGELKYVMVVRTQHLKDASLPSSGF